MKEIFVVDVDVRKRIRFLLKGKADVHPHRLAAGLRCPFVGRLHDAGTAARDDAKPLFGQKPGQALRLLVIGVVRLGPRRTEDAHGVLDLGEGFDGLDKFGHDAEDAPGLLDRQGIDDKLIPLVHVTFLHTEKDDISRSRPDAVIPGPWYRPSPVPGPLSAHDGRHADAPLRPPGRYPRAPSVKFA